MKDFQDLENQLKQTMRSRWQSKQPAATFEAEVQAKVDARRAHKRLRHITGAFALSAVGFVAIILIFAMPRFNNVPLWFDKNLQHVVPAMDSTSNAFTAFECPTPFPTPLTRMPQPTAAPPLTLNPNKLLTPKPTRVKKTRAPRPTAAPTPTIEFLTSSGQWKIYQDPKYSYAFEYPDNWSVQSSYQIIGIGQPLAGSFVSIWNYSSRRAPVRNPPEALGIHVQFYPAFCTYETLEQALSYGEPIAPLIPDIRPPSPLVPHAPVGGYPAWQHIAYPLYKNANEQLEVVVPRGKWLYRFRADPANSEQMDVFNHLLDSFTTP